MQVNGCELYVQDTGRGVPVVFSHGLLWSARMYAAQIDRLAARYLLARRQIVPAGLRTVRVLDGQSRGERLSPSGR